MATLSKEKIGIFLAVTNFAASGFCLPVIDARAALSRRAARRSGFVGPTTHMVLRAFGSLSMLSRNDPTIAQPGRSHKNTEAHQ
jgi:hypothetical protein